MKVWVVTTHTGHGEGADVMGVYASQEAARAALEDRPNMRVYITPDPDAEYSRQVPRGTLVGDPVDESKYPHVWAVAEEYEVHG